MQNQHSALYREEEREMMPMLKYYGVGTVPWGPIAAGRESLFAYTSVITKVIYYDRSSYMKEGDALTPKPA